MFPPQKSGPPERLALSRGPLFAVAGLLSLVVSVKPFAHAVGGYVRCDRHDKGNEKVHTFPPPLAAGIGGDSRRIIPAFDKCRKGGCFPVFLSFQTGGTVLQLS